MKITSLLIKPASGLCNLRCRYCFYADVSDARQVKSHGLMSRDTLELVVRRALEETEELCTFGFQGGEPTLAGLDFFRTLLELERQYNHKGIKINHALQTNGMNITAEWARFLHDNKFLVGLSIDAGKSLHDSLRLDPMGKGTHNRCLEAARLFEEHRVEFNLLSVLTRPMAAHPDTTYQFYKKRGFRHIQFIPCLDGLADEPGSHDYSLDAKTYGKFLRRFFDLWYRDFVAGHYISVRTFDNYIHMLGGLPPENCAMAGVCNPYPLIEADGSVYPCDFYALDQSKLGNVREDSFAAMLTGEAARKFSAPSRAAHPDCLGCPQLFLCRGGCRRDREPVVDGVAGKNKYCEAYLAFFDHALPRMRDIARRVC